MIEQMTLLSALLARCAKLNDMECSNQQRDERIAIIHDCWAAERTFTQWYDGLSDSDKTHTRVSSTLRMHGHETRPKLFSERFEFSNLTAAHMHMMYWALLQVLYTMLRLLYQALQWIETTYYWPPHPSALRCVSCFSLFNPERNIGLNGCHCGFINQQSRFNTSSLPALTDEHISYTMASRISMSFEYCLQQDLKILGPYYTPFPLKIAIGCFTAHLPETQEHLGWCYDVIETLEAKGLDFSRKMLGLYEGRPFGGFAG